MASPLSVFRKYQYIFLVVFGVILMISFIIAPPLDDYLRSQGGSSSRDNPVVVTYRSGKLREADLQAMRVSHNRAMFFLNQVLQETFQREATPRPVPGLFSSQADNDLLYTYLLAKKAESMGLVVSDEAIVEFLELLSDGVIPRIEMRGIMQRVLGDLPESYVLDQLRVELLAMRMRSMSQAGLFIPPSDAVTPALAWRYFKRLNRRITTEIVPLQVASFEDQVQGQPSEAQLQELYAAGKDRFAYPDRPEAGFKRRMKAVFQFVKFDFDRVREAEKANVLDEITNEEIEQHYAQNKQRYQVPDSESPDSVDSTQPESAQDGTPEQTPAEAGSTENPPSGSQAASDEGPKPPAPEPASDKKSDDAKSPTESEASQESEPSPQDASTPPSQETPSQESGAAPPPDQPDSSGSLTAPLREVFVSFNDESQAAVGGDADQGDTSQADSGQADTNQADRSQGTGSSQPAEPQSETDDKDSISEPSGDAPDKATQSPPVAEPGKQGEEEDPPGDADRAASEGVNEASNTTEPQYRPLDDKLREEIRDELADIQAGALAQQRVEVAKQEVRRQVNTMAKEYRRWDIRTDGDEQREEFSHLNVNDLELDELAEAGETPVVDAVSVREHEIGESIRMPQEFTWPLQQFPFYEDAFDAGVPMYSIGETGPEGRVSFVYWRIEEEPEYVPEFTEARDEVLSAWRQAEALKLAENQAEKLAADARSAGKPLAEIFASDEQLSVIETNAFSWMSTGFTAAGLGAPVVSQVDGVEMIGSEFMEAVFALKPAEVGVAINQPQTIVYVVRVVSETPGEDLLRQLFVQAGISREVSFIAESENLDLRRQWYDDLESEMDVQWQRPPEVF